MPPTFWPITWEGFHSEGDALGGAGARNELADVAKRGQLGVEEGCIFVRIGR